MSDVPYDCPSCGQTHPRGCRAHSGGGTRPCQLRPVTGLTVCQKHGGSSPQSKAKSQRAKAEQAAAREVARLGVKIEQHPAVALIDLVHWTSGEVAYWRDVVTRIAEDGHEALTWGLVKTETGQEKGQPTDLTTEQAGQHIAYTMLERASDRLATYAAAALRAGVDERRVQLAERQGALVADAIQRVLDALNLTPEQLELVPTVVPQMLRSITAQEAQTR